MHKLLISPVVALAILMTSPVRADQLSAPQQPVEDIANPQTVPPAPSDPVYEEIPNQPADEPFRSAFDTPTDDEEELPVGREVTKKENDPRNVARKRMWQNIALAAVAITVAIVAIILASKNNGHRHHHNHNDNN